MIDFPGVLSAIIFTPGCNFDCYYCHNRSLLEDPALIEADEVMGFLKRRQGLIDGVVISGGEPSLQHNLMEGIEEIKALGYKIKLDTNGSRPEMLEKLLKYKLLDYVAIDYKAPLDEYVALCGVNGEAVGESFCAIRESDVDYELRTTMIPEITPGKLNAMAMVFPNLRNYALQLYVPQGKDARKLYTPHEIRRLADKIKTIQPNVVVRV